MYNYLIKKVMDEKEEHGRIAPTYILLGENVYHKLEAEVSGGIRMAGNMESINSICGVPIVIDKQDRDCLGVYYRFW